MKSRSARIASGRGHVLALDQGTTSSRAIVFDAHAQVVSVAQTELPQHFPKPGWVEHDPRDLWQSQLRVARNALRKARLQHHDLAAIGITNQRETTLVWDRSTGQPIYPAIVWQDRRTARACERLRRDGLTETIREKTGLVIDPYFSATKVQWILQNVTGARRRARDGKLAFGTVDSWLLWQLTGGRCHLTDITNASRTLLFNIHTRQWDDELLKIFKIPRCMLPRVTASSGPLAETSALGGNIPITGVAGDQQAALFGQACFEKGMAKNTYGTGCFLVMNTGSKPVRSQHQLLTTIAWQIGGCVEYALEGSIFVAGAAVQWLRDALGLIKTSDGIAALAQTVPDNGGVYLVPAFAGLGAPHWDPQARGLICGITRGTHAGHIARAVLEGIAFQVRDVVEAMRADAGQSLKQLRVDGGAAVNDLLLQIQADLLGSTVVRPRITETTALGAAFLAGLAVGVWPERKTISACWKAERRFHPTIRPSQRRQLARGWAHALKRSRE